jgi:hypothetical protein
MAVIWPRPLCRLANDPPFHPREKEKVREVAVVGDWLRRQVVPVPVRKGDGVRRAEGRAFQVRRDAINPGTALLHCYLAVRLTG